MTIGCARNRGSCGSEGGGVQPANMDVPFPVVAGRAVIGALRLQSIAIAASSREEAVHGMTALSAGAFAVVSVRPEAPLKAATATTTMLRKQAIARPAPNPSSTVWVVWRSIASAVKAKS